MIKFNGIGALSKRTGGQALPQNTVSQLYESLLLDRLDSLIPFSGDETQLHQSQLNEVVPLLYTCLKLELAGDKKTKLESLHLIKNIDDFRQEDPRMELFKDKYTSCLNIDIVSRFLAPYIHE